MLTLASDSQSQQQQTAEQNQQITSIHTQRKTPRQSLPHPLPSSLTWMVMQYPAAAMMMQHQMLTPQHYVLPQLPPQNYMPYHPHIPHHPYQNQYQLHGSSSVENTTIWVGDLHHWMDENYLHNCFASTGQISSIKVIRNKQTGLSEGYGFVEFFSHATAEKVLQDYSGILMPNTEQTFHINWATCNSGDKRSDNFPDLSIFVGDLSADVTDSMLHETFATIYPSVKDAKVVVDTTTGRSKGYGFVRFGDDKERSHAITEMNGVYCSSRPMRTGAATQRKSFGYQLKGGYASNGKHCQVFKSDSDPSNTTIFVGGLDPDVTDEDFMQPFSQYGEIIFVKIPAGKHCGFVQFANRNSAEEAKEKLNGTLIGKQTVRLSWGRTPAYKQVRVDFGNQWSGAYYGGQLYNNGFGYALTPPHDPTLYAPAASPYAGYLLYGSHQQQVS